MRKKEPQITANGRQSRWVWQHEHDTRRAQWLTTSDVEKPLPKSWEVAVKVYFSESRSKALTWDEDTIYIDIKVVEVEFSMDPFDQIPDEFANDVERLQDPRAAEDAAADAAGA